MRTELLADLLLQGDARVEHHSQQADDQQIGVEIRVHLFDGVDQVGQSFQRKVLALHGHQHAVRGAQAVQREHAQRRRAVDQYKVVFIAHCKQRGFQTAFAAFKVHQFHFSAGQFAIGTQHVVTGFHGRLAGLGDGGRFQQHVVHAHLERPLVDARPHRGVALWVQIDHQHPQAQLGEAGGQVDGGGGFAHTAFLVGNAEDAHAHWVSFIRRASGFCPGAVRRTSARWCVP